MKYRSRTPYLNRLSCQWVNGASGPYLKLVKYHVPQPLIIDQTEVDVGSKLLTCYPRIHRLIAIVVIPSSSELLAEVIYGGV
jgi:hypothetical protein